MSKNLSGPSDTRSNALWGKGTRGGDSRSNALWGKGSRGSAFAVMAMFAFVLPMAAMGGSTGGNSAGAPAAYVAPGLLAKAAENPNATLHLIVQSKKGAAAAQSAFENVLLSDLGAKGTVRRKLGLVDAVAIDLNAASLAKLALNPNLTITPDSRVKMLGTPTSSQLWTQASRVNELWGSNAAPAPNAPTIAVVDSGIASRADFGDRLVATVQLNTSTGTNSAGDGRGHGSIVAALAAGGADGYAGASPTSKLVSIDILDDSGAGRASDVIAAADWILSNRGTYNIKVANFSLGVSGPGSIRYDPVNRAVEKLWFAGVVVVASSGNYGTGSSTPSGVKYAPANDPFVITVGAADIAGTASTSDDGVAAFSAWGYTADGFFKPDVIAPGRFMVGPAEGTLPQQFPERVVAPGYMRMSGTSFSAAVVSGAAAQILARHPDWSPDKVKGALMLKAKRLAHAGRGQGRGELDAAASAAVVNAPNPHHVLNRWVVADPNGGSLPVFDASSWSEHAKANSTWNESTWNESGWSESTWNESTWSEQSWSASSWSESTWDESTWAETTWDESTWAETTWAEGELAE